MPPREPAEPSPGNGPDLRAYAVQLRAMNAEFNRVAHGFAHAQELHPTDVQALVAIMDAPSTDGAPMTPGRLRERLSLTSGAVSACLDRLERAGHVRRTRDSQDRRVVHLTYEPAAADMARAYFEPLAHSLRTALDGMDADAQNVVLTFLHDLTQQLVLQRTGQRAAGT
ncbi:MarR family winged helix-turn-helix transcriptional regulator [Streptomyces montanisoli]|uniref:Winged helix-turn-helix transcriptional regulator n=1 Tax=Streptomyces montanisoli TaxID=2798581 RepID=A0A940RX01_9ACTN|nr:MarR family winged helix-turn-helix transcriptional regulator [Streptomyces montanisoli]MBP0457119.1 winged helix-turn-helix transcriptional regulator [Streptomyces montanisoli]